MKAVRLALALTAASTLALGAVAVAPAQAATGDTWSGYKVVDVVPAATTQHMIVGPKIEIARPGEDDIDLFNMVRMVEDKNGNESWVYCVDLLQQGEAPSYTEDPLKASTAAGRAHAANINRVIASSNLPAPGSLAVTAPDSSKLDVTRDRVAKNADDVIEAVAVQLAIWHYTEGINLTSSNASIGDTFYPASYSGDADDVTIGQILTRMNALITNADANPLDPANPTITITPANSTTQTGQALSFVVKGEDIDGTIAVTTDDAAVKLHPVSGSTCDTSTVVTTLPAAGGTVCAISNNALTLKVTATGSSPKNSGHLLYALDAQSIIGVGPDAAADSADAEWTGSTSTPSTTPSESPSSTPSESCTTTPSSMPSETSSDTPSESPSSTPSETCSSTPSVSETSSTGGAVVETTNAGGNAEAPSGALADTGAFGLADRMALALAALGLGTAFVVLTRRRAARTH